MTFSSRIEAVYQAYQTILSLYQQHPHPLPPECFESTLQSLKTTLDELQAAHEEIEQQHQQLLASQQQLEAERQRYRDLFNLAPDGYLVTDAQGIIQEANVAIAAMLRLEQPYLIGKPLILFFAEAERSLIHTTLDRLQHTAAAAPICQTWDTQLRSPRRDLLDVAITLACSPHQGAPITSLRWVICDITRRKQAEAKIQHQALHDPLTNLPNRAFLETFLPKALAQAERHQTQVAIAFLDLDCFKGINDTFGHSFGDRLLQQVGQRLAPCLRAEDLLVRWGGDEFIAVLTGITHTAEAGQICNRLIACLQPPIHIDDLTLHISTSFGVAFFPHDGQDPETLLRYADQALYQAKSQGRNTYRFYRHPHQP